jgi:hypothetical protein
MCPVAIEPSLIGCEGNGLIGGLERVGEIAGEDEAVGNAADLTDTGLQKAFCLSLA